MYWTSTPRVSVGEKLNFETCSQTQARGMLAAEMIMISHTRIEATAKHERAINVAWREIYDWK